MDYEQALGKSEQELHQAQNRLVNLSLRTAIDMLYRKVAQDGWKIQTDIFVNGHPITIDKAGPDGLSEPCETAEEAYRFLLQFGNQYDRVRVYNQFAKHNDFDLSLKSSGIKSMPSIAEKRVKSNLALDEVGDIVRLTAVSREPEQLNRFLLALRETVAQDAAVPPRDRLRPWAMTKTAVFKRTLNTQVDGVNAEVQVAPREQARIAARISHTYYECVRKWDTYLKDTLPAADQAVLRQQVITNYNQIAQVIDTLASRATLDVDYLGTVNALFDNMDMNVQTFDDVSEGGAAGRTAQQKPLKGEELANAHDRHPPYSPIFKRLDDIKDYRNYLNHIGSQLTVGRNGRQQPLFPLPMLEPDASDHTVMDALGRLTQCTQLTHACYMRKASVDARSAWLEAAVKVNALQPDAIPSVLVESVNRGREGVQAIDLEAARAAALQDGHGRG